MTIPEIKKRLDELKVDYSSAKSKPDFEKLLAEAEKEAQKAKVKADAEAARLALEKNKPEGSDNGGGAGGDNSKEKDKVIETKPETEVVTDTASGIGEQAPLLLINLVNGGKTLAEARAIITKQNERNMVSVTEERKNLLGLPGHHPDNVTNLREILLNAGIRVHPNAPDEKVVSIYKNRILGDQTADADGDGKPKA